MNYFSKYRFRTQDKKKTDSAICNERNTSKTQKVNNNVVDEDDNYELHEIRDF